MLVVIFACKNNSSSSSLFLCSLVETVVLRRWDAFGANASPNASFRSRLRIYLINKRRRVSREREREKENTNKNQSFFFPFEFHFNTLCLWFLYLLKESERFETTNERTMKDIKCKTHRWRRRLAILTRLPNILFARVVIHSFWCFECCYLRQNECSREGQHGPKKKKKKKKTPDLTTV